MVVCTGKAALLALLEHLRRWLTNWVGLKIHPKKIYLQHVRKGVEFVGAVILPGRIIPCKRMKTHIMGVVSEWNKGKDADREHFVQRMNSCFGFLSRRNSYAFRWKVWNSIKRKEGIYCVNMKKFKTIKSKSI